jgi:hypothetical protein
VFERQAACENSRSGHSPRVRGDSHRNQVIDNRTDGFLDSGRRLIVGCLDELIVQRWQRLAAGRFDEQDWKDRKTLQLGVWCTRVNDRDGEFDMCEARTADCVWGNLYATSIADHVPVAVANVSATRTFEVVDWTKDSLVVQSSANIVVKRG